MNNTLPCAVVVLAAGKGTRMKSALPKVLHKLAGKPMLWHVLRAVSGLKPTHTLVITGHGAEEVESAVAGSFEGLAFVRQAEQKGTGHAVQQSQQALQGFAGTVLVVCGDVPLMQTDALAGFIKAHEGRGHHVSVASAVVDDPTGLGRMVRGSGGTLMAIREHKDCTPAELALSEVNTGIYAVNAACLFGLLADVQPNNTQGEYYLTDIISLGLAKGLKVDALPIAQPADELGGVNTRVQLAFAEDRLQTRLATYHMLNGVTLQDAHSTYFSTDTVIAPDVTVGVGVVFGEGVVVETGATILPYCYVEGCTIQAGAQVGPFARIRPTTTVGEGAKIGNFVEVKNSHVGAGSKVSHLSYVGDADVGARVNVGASTVVANYNHKTRKKNRTVVGDDVSLGAHTTLVAPVEVGNHATTGAGTVVRKDVPDNALATSKAEVVVKVGYSGKYS